jgi:hypothetical protein
MARTTEKPPLTLVESDASVIPPPRPLGEHGARLWHRIQAEYGITDAGGVELLAQISAAVDRVEDLAAAIARDGAVVHTRAGPKTHPALRDELSTRAFIARSLQRLGVTVEDVKPVGRPPSSSGWIPPERR